MNIKVLIPEQTLLLLDEQEAIIKVYSVSTAKKGAGEKSGSYQTPRGKHIVRAKIGKNLPINSVLIKRRPTGEIYSEALAQANPHRDWVLTRILWLSGLEVGLNRLGDVDTMRRFIYIHGTPDSEPIGVPASHGCIRMRNKDIIELFELIPVRTPVDILIDY